MGTDRQRADQLVLRGLWRKLGLFTFLASSAVRPRNMGEKAPEDPLRFSAEHPIGRMLLSILPPPQRRIGLHPSQQRCIDSLDQTLYSSAYLFM